MKIPAIKAVRCAIYTRVSTDHGLDQEFNSLDAQYDAASAYIKSQAHAGWNLIRSRYDDGGYSGGSTDRPDLQRLLDDIRARRLDVIVVYKVDRLTRSLADFASWLSCSMPMECHSSRLRSSSTPRPRWAG
jgi:site-specific DNA recombinase